MSKTVAQANIAGRLERLPLCWVHRRLMLIHGLGWLFDAMDVGLLTFILVALKGDWKLTDPQVGMVGSAGILGMCVGSGVSGWLGDRFGRKAVFQVTLLVYAIATALCALTWNLPTMMFCRFLVGVGLGGEFPVVSALLSEFIPGKHRGRFIVYLQSFWTYGWFLAAVTAYVVIPRFGPSAGWRVAFLVGAAPALYVWVVRRVLPESPRWYASKGRMDEAQAVVRGMEHEVERLTGAALPEVVEGASAQETEEGRVPLREVWSPGYRRRTAMLWAMWFGLIFAFYGISTWLPSMLVREGYTMVATFGYVIIVTVVQIPGYFCAAFLIDRLGRKPVIVVFFLGYALSAYGFGQAAGERQIVVWASVMNFFNMGVFGAVYTYTAELYPTALRATGAGSAAAFGRIGGIISPIAIGMMLPAMGKSGVMGIMAGFLVIPAAVVWALGAETKGETLEESSAREDPRNAIPARSED